MSTSKLHGSRVAELQPGAGSSSFVADYSGRLGFSVAQVDSGSIIHPGSVLEMQKGQQADYIFSGWEDPTQGQAEIIEAWNKSGSPQLFALGSVTGPTGELELVPIYLWKVGNTLSADAKFHPVLLLHVSMDTKHNAAIPGDIRSMVIKKIDFSKIQGD
ncbi:hypothetical protein L218DRAFT_1005933 [Marasmius fiardii PR-910]|nr:hypothetical protein L218DRAFT_1005933 [Marasmius fiardii PR-910]